MIQFSFPFPSIHLLPSLFTSQSICLQATVLVFQFISLLLSLHHAISLHPAVTVSIHLSVFPSLHPSPGAFQFLSSLLRPFLFRSLRLSLSLHRSICLPSNSSCSSVSASFSLLHHSISLYTLVTISLNLFIFSLSVTLSHLSVGHYLYTFPSLSHLSPSIHPPIHPFFTLTPRVHLIHPFLVLHFYLHFCLFPSILLSIHLILALSLYLFTFNINSTHHPISFHSLQHTHTHTLVSSLNQLPFHPHKIGTIQTHAKGKAELLIKLMINECEDVTD